MQEWQPLYQNRWMVGIIGLVTAFDVALLFAVDAGWDAWWTPAVLLLVLFMGMRTRVDGSGISVAWIPFWRRKENWADIAAVSQVTFRPLREHGGWGVRWVGKGHWAYTVTGTTGVEILTTDGRRWTIGSGRPEQLLQAIRFEQEKAHG